MSYHANDLLECPPEPPIDELVPCTDERVQARVLEILGIEIVDLADYCDDCIPDNYPRFQVSRDKRPIGTISTWGNKYCTRMVPSLVGYSSLYEAATCWLDSYRLKQIEEVVNFVLEKQRFQMKDYF